MPNVKFSFHIEIPSTLVTSTDPIYVLDTILSNNEKASQPWCKFTQMPGFERFDRAVYAREMFNGDLRIWGHGVIENECGELYAFEHVITLSGLHGELEFDADNGEFSCWRKWSD